MTAYRNALPRTRGHGPSRSRSAGFTLIEIMIVVLIISILAALAYAGYDWAVVKTKRATAAGCALEAAQFMERYRTTEMSYVDADGNAPAWPGCSADVSDYAVAIAEADATSFSITATPEGRQESKDTDCGVLSLNQTGTREVSGDKADDPGYCW
jgi:type IV pilus assembly protein PilE